MEAQGANLPQPSEESWKAFEGYLRGSLLGTRVERLIDGQRPGVARFGFSVKMGEAIHTIRVRHQFWRDIRAQHIRTALSVMRLADEIRGCDRLTVVMRNGAPTVCSGG